MSVNNRHSIDTTKTKHYGKYYSTIDFEIDEKVTAEQFRRAPERPVLGSFEIAGKSYPLTWTELDTIERTAKEAKIVIMQRYRMGLM